MAHSIHPRLSRLVCQGSQKPNQSGKLPAPDQNVYELSRATTRALYAFDKPLRDRLSTMDKRSMELHPLEHIEVLEGSFASVKTDWPFSKLASS